MHVLVTGANGFLGQHTVQALLAQSLHVIAVQRGAASHPPHPHVSVVRGDLSPAFIAGLDFSHIDAVIHLAFDMSASQADMARFALDSTHCLIQACAANGSRFILASSFSVYDWGKVGAQLNSQSPLLDDTQQPCLYGDYAQVKRLQERMARQWCHAMGVPLSVVRPSKVWDATHLPSDVLGIGLDVGLGKGRVQLVVRPARMVHTIHVKACAQVFVDCLQHSAKQTTVIASDDNPVSAMNLARQLYPHVRCLPFPEWVLGILAVVSPVAERLLRSGYRVPGLLLRARVQARFPWAIVQPGTF